jgi:hypothetical protein
MRPAAVAPAVTAPLLPATSASELPAHLQAVAVAVAVAVAAVSAPMAVTAAPALQLDRATVLMQIVPLQVLVEEEAAVAAVPEAAAVAEVAAQHRQQPTAVSHQSGASLAHQVVMVARAAAAAEVAAAHRVHCVSPLDPVRPLVLPAEPAAEVANHKWRTSHSLSFFCAIRKMMPRKILDVLLMPPENHIL